MPSPTNYDDLDDDYEEKLIDQGGEVLKTIVPKMVLIWKELGFPPTESEDRLHAVLTHHKELWEAMLVVEKAKKKKILSTVDRLGRKYYNLCKELGSSVEDFGADPTPLLEVKKLLNEAIALLSVKKEEKMKAVRVLFKKEDQLCRRLCIAVSPTNRDKIPTDAEFQVLQDIIKKLKAEISRRQSQYVVIRDTIRDAMQQLEMSARTPLQLDIFFKEPSSVSLSDQDMAKLMELQSSLISRLELNKRKANELREIIETLWERLNIEQDVREIFMMENKGHAPSTINSLEREKGRLIEFKEQHLKISIKAVRQNLTFWWGRCYVSEEERSSFTPFYTEMLSDHLVELHQVQIEKFKKLHAQYKDIFMNISHRDNLWKRLEDIERKSKDPVRLFGNRGCALLPEQKERTKIFKELPRVEEQLLGMLDNYERERGQILLIDGADYRITVRDQWSNHEASKENAKDQMQKERAEKLMEEAKGGAKPSTPMKRRLGTPGLLRTQVEPLKAKQRKLVLAPSSAPPQRTDRKVLTEDRLNNLRSNLQKKGDANSILIAMDNGKAAAASCASPTRTPYRRSSRLASRTALVTPLSAAHKNHCLMARRSKTEPMPPRRFPSSARPLTPTQSTPKLVLAVHPHPFVV